MRNTLIFVVFLLVGNSVSAANVWKSDAYIKGVQALANGDYLIMTTASDLTACNGDNQLKVSVGENTLTAEGAKIILSMALVSLSSKTKVSVFYDNASQSCFVQQMYLSNNT